MTARQERWFERAPASCEGTAEGCVDHVRPSRDGSLVAACWRDGVAVLLDESTLEPRWRLEGHEAGVVAALFSPDSRCLYTLSLDGTLRAWDVARGEELRAFPLPEAPRRGFATLDLYPEGDRLLALWSTGKSVMGLVLAPSTWRVVERYPPVDAHPAAARLSESGAYLDVVSAHRSVEWCGGRALPGSPEDGEGGKGDASYAKGTPWVFASDRDRAVGVVLRRRPRGPVARVVSLAYGKVLGDLTELEGAPAAYDVERRFVAVGERRERAAGRLHLRDAVTLAREGVAVLPGGEQPSAVALGAGERAVYVGTLAGNVLRYAVR